MKKDVLINSISEKDDVIFYEYEKNTYYVYHETAPNGYVIATVYGWVTPKGLKRSCVVERRINLEMYANVSSRWFALFVKSLVKGNYKFY